MINRNPAEDWFHRSQLNHNKRTHEYKSPSFMPKVSCAQRHTHIDIHWNLKISNLAGRHFIHSRATSFRMYYGRGDLPIKMEYLTGGEKIAWTVDIEKLDYSLYLPLFFDGLSELKHPYKTYARQGVQDLLSSGGDKIYPVIPQLIIPIKSNFWVQFLNGRPYSAFPFADALNTKSLEVMCVTLKILQQLVMSSDLVGPALVPFYRQLLPMFNAFKVKNCM